jgi:hypothetical protein
MDTKFVAIEAGFKTTGCLTDGQIAWLTKLAKSSNRQSAAQSKCLLDYYYSIKGETQEEEMAHINAIAGKEGGRLLGYDEFYLCRLMEYGETEHIRIEARNALVVKMMPYVRHIVDRILRERPIGEDMKREDLEHEAYLLILEAVGKYRLNPENPARFSTFILRFLHKEVNRLFFQDNTIALTQYGAKTFAKLKLAFATLGFEALPADSQTEEWKMLEEFLGSRKPTIKNNYEAMVRHKHSSRLPFESLFVQPGHNYTVDVNAIDGSPSYEASAEDAFISEKTHSELTLVSHALAGRLSPGQAILVRNLHTYGLRKGKMVTAKYLGCDRRKIEDMIAIIREKTLSILAESKLNPHLSDIDLSKFRTKKVRRKP